MNTHRKGPDEMTGPSAPVCHPAGDVTGGTTTRVTCSDDAVEMEIVRLEPGGLAMARASAGSEEISVALVDAEAGDTVLVHAGEAIAVV